MTGHGNNRSLNPCGLSVFPADFHLSGKLCGYFRLGCHAAKAAVNKEVFCNTDLCRWYCRNADRLKRRTDHGARADLNRRIADHFRFVGDPSRGNDSLCFRIESLNRDAVFFPGLCQNGDVSMVGAKFHVIRDYNVRTSLQGVLYPDCSRILQNLSRVVGGEYRFQDSPAVRTDGHIPGCQDIRALFHFQMNSGICLVLRLKRTAVDQAEGRGICLGSRAVYILCFCRKGTVRQTYGSILSDPDFRLIPGIGFFITGLNVDQRIDATVLYMRAVGTAIIRCRYRQISLFDGDAGIVSDPGVCRLTVFLVSDGGMGLCDPGADQRQAARAVGIGVRCASGHGFHRYAAAAYNVPRNPCLRMIRTGSIRFQAADGQQADHGSFFCLRHGKAFGSGFHLGGPLYAKLSGCPDIRLCRGFTQCLRKVDRSGNGSYGNRVILCANRASRGGQAADGIRLSIVCIETCRHLQVSEGKAAVCVNKGMNMVLKNAFRPVQRRRCQGNRNFSCLRPGGNIRAVRIGSHFGALRLDGPAAGDPCTG